MRCTRRVCGCIFGPCQRSGPASREGEWRVKETKKPRLAARLFVSMSCCLVLDGTAEAAGRLARGRRVVDAGDGRIGERLQVLRLERGRVARRIVEDRTVCKERRA